MPLENHDSYLPTLQDYLAHWALVDAALAPGAMVLQDGVSRGDLQAFFLAMRGELDALGSLGVGIRVRQEEAGLRRAALRGWMGLFKKQADVWWRGEPAARMLQKLPGETEALEKLTAWCRDALRLWDRLNAGPAPAGVSLPLRVGAAPGLSRAGFAALLDGLATERLALEDLLFAERFLREERDAREAKVRQMLSGYSGALETTLPRNHYLLDTAPRLYPLPGHTPGKVTLTAAWDAERNAARLTWTASEDAKLEHYEIRRCAGAVYDKARERAALRIPKDAPREAWVAEGLAAAGDVASFKVYVVLKTGNERGSSAVAVGR